MFKTKISTTYIDIPVNIQETPAFVLEKLTTYVIPEDSIDMGLDFIERLTTVIKSQDNQHQFYSLIFNYYELVSSGKNKEKYWPAIHEIQAKYEDKTFSPKAQAIYNELINRVKFDQLKHSQEKIEEFLIVAEDSWDAYESIFTREFKEVSFPPIIVWEILQNFLYELSQYHYLKESFPKSVEVNEDIFNIEESKRLLGKLATFLPKEYSKSVSSRQLFAYYSLVISATLEVYLGNYQAALDIASQISLNYTLIYSRSFGCLLNLFLTTSYSYFMLQHYKESARLGEMFLIFYQKNKKYFSKINSQRLLARQYEKIAGLLCLNYIFLEERPKSVIMDVFKNTSLKVKDKQHKERLIDKYFKLKQNDQGTFSKLFNHCFMPVIGSQITLTEQQEIVFSRFIGLQSITLNTILQHYTQISISKVANMLNISEEEVRKLIESFNDTASSKNAWEESIMGPLLRQSKKVDIQIVENMVRLDTEQIGSDGSEWDQYRNQVNWLVEKVNAL